MRSSRTSWAVAIAVAATLSPSVSVAGEAGGTALTIYSTLRPGAVPPELYRDGGRGQSVPGYAVVRNQRELALKSGRNTVRFTDVAALIDPTTVSFESLTDAKGTSVVEQNFQFDLVNTQRLLQKYVDRAITVDQVRGNGVESFRGTLLSVSGGLTLKREDGSIQILPHNAGIKLPELPGGLITRPTLVWDIAAARAGTHKTRVSYQTGGITWWADYNVTHEEGANANACRLDVGAWVSIVNQSGASYPDAKLKLVAGDVQRVAPPGQVHSAPMAARAMAREDRAAGFEEKAFFEYHLYTLGRATTLPDNSTKQIELFPAARGVPCEKTLVYYGLTPAYGFGPSPITDRNYGTQTNKKVDVYLTFKNATENNMGMPLPSGRIRVNKMDSADAALEFIGEDKIDHTPKNEKVLIKMGSAFDVVGERRQVNFSVDTSRRTMSEEIEVKLRNHKREAVTVIVKENLYRWVNWQITSKTHDFRKQDARTIHFPLKVGADGEGVLRYTVQYNW
ncbi:MAG: DUF4139 domain-containing protein [Betaproteobacteria bacterium]|nr:DUF4139 domain-containing protein [Betaproteobacteria bacterium]